MIQKIGLITSILGVFSPFVSASSLSLQEAIATALKNNQKKSISLQDQRIAKARYDQALSGNYPILDISLIANKRDDNLIDEVDDDVKVPAFGTMHIAYTHVIMGTDTAIAQADAKYALYTGGKIASLQEQARQGIRYAEESDKQTDDDIALHVKQYYAASVLSRQLVELTQETVDRMEAINEITEAFYKGESLSVKKTDFLRSKLMLLSMRSMLEEMKEKMHLAQSALLFEMGEDADKEIVLSDGNLHEMSLPHTLEEYYETLYLNSHLLSQADIGLKVRDAQIDEAVSEYLPTVGLYANTMSIYNNRQGGLINSTNNDSWSVGVALQYNLFSGGLSSARVEEAKAEKMKLQAQQAYMKSGLTLKTKQAFLSLQKSANQVAILKEAVAIAAESRDLNFRAYQEDMVPTKDVVEAQIFESVTKASYYKAQYEAVVSKAELDYTIGTSL